MEHGAVTCLEHEATVQVMEREKDSLDAGIHVMIANETGLKLTIDH